MEASRISSLRTALVSVIGAKLLTKPGPLNLGVIGLGVIGIAHVEAFTKHCDLASISLYDQNPAVTKGVSERLRKEHLWNGDLRIAASHLHVLATADCVVTATTVSAPYIDFADLRPGQTVINVSLDDLKENAFHQANQVWVDDLQLVLRDRRRCLGRLLRDKGLQSKEQSVTKPRLAGTIDTLVSSGLRGRYSDTDIVIFNPFGMSILDVGLASSLMPHVDANMGLFVELD